MRLVDCFTELFYYTVFLKSLDFSQFSYDNVIKHYKELIPRAREAASKAGFSRTNWEMGFFAACAWIDETILCSDWAEREQWARAPLQLVFFKTTNAGGEFFTRLASLDKKDKSIREVYDYCLALGLKGCYYLPENADELKEIERSNLKLLTENSILAFPETLFSKAYTFTLKHPKRMLRPWGLDMFTLLGVSLPVISFVILYYIYNKTLTDIVFSYFNTGF